MASRPPVHAATISASAEDRETAVCLREWEQRGKKECGPTKAINVPDVLFTSLLSPAESASEK